MGPVGELGWLRDPATPGTAPGLALEPPAGTGSHCLSCPSVPCASPEHPVEFLAVLLHLHGQRCCTQLGPEKLRAFYKEETRLSLQSTFLMLAVRGKCTLHLPYIFLPICQVLAPGSWGGLGNCERGRQSLVVGQSDLREKNV
ncbi:hypothetical protein Nmel_018722 [Mimus melanotis]